MQCVTSGAYVAHPWRDVNRREGQCHEKDLSAIKKANPTRLICPLDNHGLQFDRFIGNVEKPSNVVNLFPGRGTLSVKKRGEVEA